MKTKYVFAIFCTLAIIVSSASVYGSWRMQEEKTKDEGILAPILQDGGFTAELGTARDKEEPLYSLNGNYQKEDGIITCYGTAIIRDIDYEFTGTFKKGYFEITIRFEERPLVIEGKYKLDKNGEDFQGEWCTGGRDGDRDKDKCFKFVYPITYIMPDGTTITIENKDDWDEIKAWYEANPDIKERPELQYPVDIKWPDGTIQTINNDEEMKDAYERCKGRDRDKESGWITGTFQGMEDGKAKNIPTILERYPLIAKLIEGHIFKRILLLLGNLIRV